MTRLTRLTRYVRGWPCGDLLIVLTCISALLGLLWLIKAAALWIFSGG